MVLRMPVAPELRSLLGDEFERSTPHAGELSASLVEPGRRLFALLETAEAQCLPDMVDIPAGNFFFWVVSRGNQPLHAMRLGYPEI